MVRAKKKQISTSKGRTAKSKSKKGGINSGNSNNVLNKTKKPKFTSANDINCLENISNISTDKKISINDNDKHLNIFQQPGNSAIAKKTITSTNSTPPSISNSSDVSIFKQGVTDIAINKVNTVSTTNASLLQESAAPQILSTTRFRPKYVFIKIDTPLKIFEHIRTVRSSICDSNSDKPLSVKRGQYDNSAVKIVPMSSLTSQPTVPQKDKSIEPSVQKNDQSKRNPIILVKKQSKSIQPNVLQQLQSKNIQPADQQNDKSKTTKPGIQKKEQNEINYPNILPKDQNKSMQPNIVQKEQNSNIIQSIHLSDQNVSTVQNDLSVNTKQSNLEKLQIEILNTKYLPIKPKPPSYQDTRPLFTTPSKTKQKSKKDKGLINKYNCIVCDRKFLNTRTLIHHQRKLHRVFISSGQGYECRICGRQQLNPQSRSVHEARFHLGRQQNMPHYKCPACLSTFQGMKSIKEHMSKDHSDINLEPQNITFNSKGEFEKWKATIEGNTASQYVMRHSHKYQGFEKLDFACHRRSAINLKLKGTRNRKMKYKGSVKTGLFCPAFITLNETAKSIEVTYNLTHLGHECDVEYIAMQKRIKSYQNCTLLRCRVCKKVFSQSTYRKHHEKEVHGLDVKYDLALKCPVCFTVFPTRKKMMHHFLKSHSHVSLQTTQLTFRSLKEFNDWKSSMERETESEYVLDQVYQKTPFAFRRFNCHLSGSGENRLFCPANVLLKLSPKENISVDVTYISTHVGHTGENYQVSDKSESSSVTNKCISTKDGHTAAVKVYQSVHVIKKDENTWVVLPFGNEDRVYEVKRLHVEPNHVCKFKCSSCNVCSHQFKCNCSGSCLKLVCVHIHIVCLKENQSEEREISDNSCLDVDMSYYSEHEQEDNNRPENDILQGIGGSHGLNNLKEQAMHVVSTFETEIRNCNDEEKLKRLINSLSNLKNEFNSKHKLYQKRKDSLQKNIRVNENQDNVLARVIQVAMQLKNSDSPY